MPRFLVDLWLDGYESEKEMEEACEDFIHEQLNMTASSVRIERLDNFADAPTKEEEDEFDRKFKYFAGVARENNFITVWSMYDEVENMYDKHPYGKIELIKYEGLLEAVPGDTWLDLWKAADKVIRRSEDFHHIFIEDFKPIDSVTLELFTGS